MTKTIFFEIGTKVDKKNFIGFSLKKEVKVHYVPEHESMLPVYICNFIVAIQTLQKDIVIRFKGFVWKSSN